MPVETTSPALPSRPLQEVIETVFAKLRELADGDRPSRFLPNGIESFQLNIKSASDAQGGFEVSLKVGSAVSAVAEAAEQDDLQVLFNAEGHHIIALIALADLRHRSPATAGAVNSLLALGHRTLLQAATFPDEIRGSQPQTKPFHFIDIPFEDGGPRNPPLPQPPHVISKLADFTHQLSDKSAPTQQKVDALSWLIHLVGDIHQPLHCIEHISALHPGGDRGGNSFLLRGNLRNLHSLWDSSLDISNMPEDELVRSIMDQHPRASLAQDLATVNPELWARGSFNLAKKFAYSLEENPSNPPRPTAAYLKQANQIARRQAALASYRLADRLQSVFG